MIYSLIKALEHQQSIINLLDNKAIYRHFDGSITNQLNVIEDKLHSLNIPNNVLCYYYAAFFVLSWENLIMKVKFSNQKISQLYCCYAEAKNTRYVMDVQYDGSQYAGFQKQRDQKTVQSTLEDVLSALYNHPISVHASGRTDRGVHALKQTIHFDSHTTLPIDRLITIINQTLPGDIRALNVYKAPSVFHARYDAISKTYRYILTQDRNPYKSHYSLYIKSWETPIIREKLNLFVGQNNFANFSKKSDKSSTVRTIHCIRVFEEKNDLIIEITASGFLHNMVRIMIGAALYLDLDTIVKGLNNPQSPIAKHVVPASGLYLKKVNYTFNSKQD